MPTEILFLSYYFPPYCITPSIRALELTKRLIDYGFKIFVASVKNNKLVSKDIKLLKEIESPYIINKVVTHIRFPFNLAELILKKISPRFDFLNPTFFFHWIPTNIIALRKLIKKNNIKLLYTTGPPFFSLYLGFFLKKLYKIPLIIEYRDPWSFNPYETNVTSENYKKKKLKIEKKIIKSADAIIAISDGMKEFLLEKFPSEIGKKKIVVLPSGLNVKNLSMFKSESNLDKNEISFTFTGTLYGLRDLKPLIQIISEVKKLGILDEISIKINIYGKYNFDYLSSLINRYKVEKIFSLKGFISHNECYRQINKCTLPLHIGENFNYPTISFKVWEYLSLGKKIVYLGREDSYTAEYLRKYDFGYVIPLNNLKLGVEKFKKLINNIRAEKVENHVTSKAISPLTWDERIKTLVDLFNDLI